MYIFKPDLNILPPAQRNVWNRLGVIPKNFVLYGGTAIALHLGHRSSVDFDFFSHDSFESDRLCHMVSSLGTYEVLQAQEDTLTIVLTDNDPVKISFFGGIKTGRVKSPLETDDKVVLVASLLDLMGHKLKTVLQRVEAKDYIDIACMLKKGFQLEQGLSCVLSLWPFAPVQEIVRTLTYFQEGDFSELSNQDRQILIRACSDVSFESITKYPLNSERISDYCS
ncbi:conserved hypothetical protein [Desulfonatronospira thiodismutans ASO3-1]|uniref:Nucleotidyl transferase AbiEii/AbiGii toxin family protein n=1 Tax=Desulfonatronospira thiodismutans ASO3-1 TaxID=555779 RepID=D6SKC7_9BACT|nr:nucleotidyl transferase AbiEii/AbiGii toxin family protein [Desulfonatronospira thiodismutans]EFI36330.1 conserved hypothetical protein [Desulfonatronospira thiodismutans ASO3-1]